MGKTASLARVLNALIVLAMSGFTSAFGVLVAIIMAFAGCGALSIVAVMTVATSTGVALGLRATSGRPARWNSTGPSGAAPPYGR